MAKSTTLTDTITWGTALPDKVITVYFVPNGESRTYDSFEDDITSEGFTAYEKAQFQQAFDRISSVADVTFQIVTGAAAGADADFQLVLDTDEISAMPQDDQFLGYFNPQGETYEGVGVFNGALWDRQDGGDLRLGGFGYVTLMHELLHGMGLAHPHDDGGTSTVMNGVSRPFDDYGNSNLNQGVYTTMTYNSGWLTGAVGSDPAFSGTFGHEAGPMALDIAVLQNLYGAVARNTGNTVYRLPDANKAGTMWRAIWDTKGYDEIRYDGDRDATLDIRAATLEYGPGGGGFISAARGIAGGYTIAHGVTIEKVVGGQGADRITGNDASNVLVGRNGADIINAGRGADKIYGGNNADRLNGNDGRDEIFGGFGNDRITGGWKDDILRGDDGNDFMQGGNENDRLWGGNGADMMAGEDGRDVMGGGNGSDRMWGGNANDIMAGDAGADQLRGGAGRDTLRGGDGNDQLWGDGGNDLLEGNAGNDRLQGGTGKDLLRGGIGSDTFVFGQIADSKLGANADVIGDFNPLRDRIDLRGIDADWTAGGNQAYAFRGGAGFNDAGQVRVIKRNGDTIVQLSNDNDKFAEMEITLRGNINLTADDFLL